MKSNRVPKVWSILVVFFICLSLNTSAHEGGHYHKSYGDVLNQWHLLNGQVVYGNFSQLEDSVLYLEGFEGKKMQYPLNQLAPESRSVAIYHFKRISRLNDLTISKSGEFIPGFAANLSWVGIILSIALLILGFLIKKIHGISWVGRVLFYFGIMGFSVVTLIACRKSSSSNTGGAVVTIPRTRLSFLDSAFAPYQSSVSTNSDNNYYFVSSMGWPSHNMMVGITSWQQQVPIPQPYTGTNHWSIPLQPAWASTPLSTRTNFMKGAVAIAVNGIPIFNALNNRGVDSYATGELDQWGGHCGRADDYHYHAAPLHLSQTSGRMPIAFALDGFPVYGSLEPDGSLLQSLDTCHGHAWGSQVYHYHGTTTYPYVVGAMRGKVTLDPTTAAPENQILPQAFASPLRPATSPLNGAVITDFVSTGTNAYKLTYRIGAKFAYVEYNWTASNFYTYKLTDTAGVVTINSYQR